MKNDRVIELLFLTCLKTNSLDKIKQNYRKIYIYYFVKYYNIRILYCKNIFNINNIFILQKKYFFRSFLYSFNINLTIVN